MTNGAKSAIYAAFAATLDPGDEVIVPAPYWVSYPDAALACDGAPVPVACPEEQGFKLTPAQLEAAITPRTRWLVLNSPSNPTGATYTADEYRALAEVLVRHPHVMVMTDDIYEHIRFDERRRPAPPRRRAGAARPHAGDQRRLQDLRDDRLAHRLGGRPEGADPRARHAAVAGRRQRLLGQPGGRRRGAERRPVASSPRASPPTARAATRPPRG